MNERGEFENSGLFNGWVAKRDDKKFIKEFGNYVGFDECMDKMLKMPLKDSVCMPKKKAA